jgi:diacylglycerol O-acyltransferase
VLAPADRSLIKEEDFLAWCARRSMIRLERNRPLWRLDTVPVVGDRIGLLLVLHHVVADGLRGVTLVTSLLDVKFPSLRTTTCPT